MQNAPKRRRLRELQCDDGEQVELHQPGGRPSDAIAEMLEEVMDAPVLGIDLASCPGGFGLSDYGPIEKSCFHLRLYQTKNTSSMRLAMRHQQHTQETQQRRSCQKQQRMKSPRETLGLPIFLPNVGAASRSVSSGKRAWNGRSRCRRVAPSIGKTPRRVVRKPCRTIAHYVRAIRQILRRPGGI